MAPRALREEKRNPEQHSTRADFRQSILGRKVLAKGSRESAVFTNTMCRGRACNGSRAEHPLEKGWGWEMRKFGNTTSWNNAF